VPRIFGEDADLDALGRIGATVKILREQFAALQMIQEILVQDIEMLARDAGIVVPPDLICGQIVANDKLVLRAAARMYAGIGYDRAVDRQSSFPAPDRFLDENRLQLIPPDRCEIFRLSALHCHFLRLLFAHLQRVGGGRQFLFASGKASHDPGKIRCETRVKRTSPD
jgi:hypothetical protein